MAWDIEPWSASNELATQDDSGFDEPEIIDVDYSFVQPDEPSWGSDDIDYYEPEPIPEPERGGSWDSPVEYAEPEVIDTPFTFLQPNEAHYPVKKNSWGWGNNTTDIEPYEDSVDSEEIERYTASWLSSNDDEPETQDADYEYIDPETRGLENPYQRSTEDFFRHVETGVNEAKSTASASAVGSWFGSQAKNDTKQRTQNYSRADSKPNNSNRREPDALDKVSEWLGFGGGTPTNTPTATASGSPSTSVQMGSGGSSTKDYGWYFIAQDDPREDPDIHALRHFYFLYEYGDGNEEWPEADFHKWVQSLNNGDYQLYKEAGAILMENGLVDHMKNGTLKTAYLSMRLQGDSPDSQRNDVIGRVSAAVLRGFS